MSQPHPPQPDQPWHPPADPGTPTFPGFTPQRPTYAGQEPPTQPMHGSYPSAPHAPHPYAQQPYGPPPPYGPQQPYGPPPPYAHPGYAGPPTPPYGQAGYRGGTTFPAAPSDPWLTDAGPVHTSTDLLGPAVAPRRRRRTVAIAVGVVLALVVGGAAVAGAALWYGWGTTEPEDVLPGSSIAFARIDLSPGLGQQLALGNLAKKFPRQQGGDDIVNSAKQNLVREILAPLDYDTDIKPWLGDRLGVSMWAPGANHAACAVVALASTNDAKAKDALARVAHSSFALSKGYAIVAQCNGAATADDAVAAAHQETLSGHAAFANALGHLPSGQAILAWVDGAHLGDLARSVTDGGPDFQNSAAQLNGMTMLAGVRATGDGLELRVRVHTSTAGTAGPADALSQLDGLPGGTVVGVAADFAAVKNLNDSLNQSLGSLPSGAGGPDVRRFMHDLLGSKASLSMVDAASPQMRLLIQAADSGSAQDMAGLLRQWLDRSDVKLSVSGSTVNLSSSGYQGGSGVLRDDPLYRTAMADAPKNTLLAAYVNIQQLVPAMKLNADELANIKPVKAVGLSTGTDDGASETLLRLVIQ